MVNEFNKFENLGILKDFCEKYGSYTITIEDFNKPNICLNIKSNQEIEIKLYCSYPLSNIIRNNNISVNEIEQYTIYRITETNNRSYIRVSQSISFDADPDLSIDENFEKVENIPGRKTMFFKFSDLNVEPVPKKPIDLDDYIKL